MKKYRKFFLGIVLGLFMSILTIYAAVTVIKSSDVTYDNSKSGGSSENVQGTIDELYKRADKLSGILDEEWKDPTLNGAVPELSGKLIPVTIDDDGTVHYANLYTKWYNYSEKRWANAVILVNKPSKNYETGDVIAESDIQSYFVWIPRFKYKIWNLGNYTTVRDLTGLIDDGLTNDGEGSNKLSVRMLFGNARIIDVVFEAKTVPRTNGTKVGDYLTHPAFKIGETELNGLWVGKFETGYNQNTNTDNPITTENINTWSTNGANQNKTASANVIVKPNVYSWRNSTVYNMFMTAYNYQRSLESHMMKNTEWGAVAYLSHSAYGIGNEININNNNAYKTGYSAAADTDQSSYPGTYGTADTITKPYNTPTGYLASTTGNITGVYDMSGGAHEYMASYTDGYGVKSSGNISSGFSEEDLTTYKDYLDVYPADSGIYTYNKRILGDATGEMGPFFYYKDKDENLRPHNVWYSDTSYFVGAPQPWFIRGGFYNNGVLAGQFIFHRESSDKYTSAASRLVLAIK